MERIKWPRMTLFCKGTQEYGRVINCSEDQRDIEIIVNRKGVKKSVTADARNVIPILRANDDNQNHLEN